MEDEHQKSIVELYDLKDYKGCISLANSIVQEFQSLSSRLNQIIGNSYFFENDFEKAIERYNIALREKEELSTDEVVELFFFLGKAFYFLDDYESSFMYLSAAQRIDSNHDMVLCFLSAIFLKTKDFDRSMSYINKAVDLCPFRTVHLYKRAQIFFQQKDYKNTVLDCNRIVQIDSNIIDVYCLRGDAQVKLFDYLNALESYSLAIQLDRSNANLFLFRGIIKDILNDQQGAMNDFKHALELPCEDVIKSDIYDNIGLIFLKTGQFQLAIRNQNTAILLNDSNSQMFLNRGIAKANIPDYLGAIDDLKRAIDLDPTNIGSYDVLSQVYESIKKYKEAKEYFAKFVYFSNLLKSNNVG